MRVSWVKYVEDNENFKIPERLGFDVFRLDKPEQIDLKIDELIKYKYDTIVLSSEIALFSSDIIKKYAKGNDVKIIIAKRRE